MARFAIAAFGSVIALAVATPAAAQGWDRGDQREWRGEDGYRQRSFDRHDDRRDRRHRRGNPYWGQGYNPDGGYRGYNGYYGYDQYGYGRQYNRYDNARRSHHGRQHDDDDD